MFEKKRLRLDIKEEVLEEREMVVLSGYKRGREGHLKSDLIERRVKIKSDTESKESEAKSKLEYLIAALNSEAYTASADGSMRRWTALVSYAATIVHSQPRRLPTVPLPTTSSTSLITPLPVYLPTPLSTTLPTTLPTFVATRSLKRENFYMAYCAGSGVSAPITTEEAIIKYAKNNDQKIMLQLITEDFSLSKLRERGV